MLLFKKPKWLKPEINEPKYWLHIILLVLITFYLVSTFIEPMEITVTNVLQGSLVLTIADVIVHTVLRLD